MSLGVYRHHFQKLNATLPMYYLYAGDHLILYHDNSMIKLEMMELFLFFKIKMHFIELRWTIFFNN
ncbi:hypothetical protein BpHYR1_048676 [Brachionus plicatilis]|uniref:Uncharacterized protein n=1 Tax=Brachionus plicatilis TaxID=10195 RepID=A0A3M7T1C3_BRAPC|nr:hypothetical protein BpHYR1_048676 [Brachionus plicatilis]